MMLRLSRSVPEHVRILADLLEADPGTTVMIAERGRARMARSDGLCVAVIDRQSGVLLASEIEATAGALKSHFAGRIESPNGTTACDPHGCPAGEGEDAPTTSEHPRHWRAEWVDERGDEHVTLRIYTAWKFLDAPDPAAEAALHESRLILDHSPRESVAALSAFADSAPSRAEPSSRTSPAALSPQRMLRVSALTLVIAAGAIAWRGRWSAAISIPGRSI